MSKPRKLALVLRTQLVWGWRLRRLGRRTVIGRAKVVSPERISLGSKVLIDDWTVLNGGGSPDSSIVIGDRVTIREFALIEAHKGRIELGEHVFIGPRCSLSGQGLLVIGRDTMIAGGTLIIPSNHNFDQQEVPYQDQGETSKGITIGTNCWIGANCTILDGVELGDNAVVAAGSVVSKSVPADTLAAGVPAKPLKRYDKAAGRWQKID